MEKLTPEEIEKIDALLTRQIRNITLGFATVYAVKQAAWVASTTAQRFIDMKVLPWPTWNS